MMLNKLQSKSIQVWRADTSGSLELEDSITKINKEKKNPKSQLEDINSSKSVSKCFIVAFH